MRNIICDTMIWYYLGNGLLDYKEFSNDNLIATRVNIYELANTPNLYKDFNYYRNALLGLRKYHSSIIEHAPIQYIGNCGLQKFEFNFEPLEAILRMFDKIIGLPNDFQLEEEHYNEFKEKIEILKKENSLLTHDCNNLLPIVRENIKNISGKKNHRMLDSTCYIKMLIKKTVRKGYSIKWQDFDWKKIEYLVKVWDLYFKELELCSTRKIDENDWNDIWNFSYVKPDFYYLTCENKWFNIIKNEDYLFDKLIYKKLTPHNT